MYSTALWTLGKDEWTFAKPEGDVTEDLESYLGLAASGFRKDICCAPK